MRRFGQLVRSGPVVRISSATPVSLAELGLERQPPAHVLGPGGPPADFDRDTLFFDVFRVGDSEIVCLGPQLDGITPEDFRVNFAGVGYDGAIDVRYEPPRMHQQPVGRFILTAPGIERVERLRVEIGNRHVIVAPQPAVSDWLAGERVLMTLSKDNNLQWIEDWASFHVARQGASAVLLYDNGSTTYTVEDVARALSRVPGLQRVVVVSWPFPYGVGGSPPHPPLNFCQTGMLDHARRCFCAKAASVLNLDIDELLPRTGQTIFERIESDGLAALHFRGVWVEKDGIGSHTEALALRHADCEHVWRSQFEAIAAGSRDALCRTKWVAVPSRCGPGTEWGVHQVYAATEDARRNQRAWRATDEGMHYRHFRQINSGWKSDRWRSSIPFDAIPDRELIENMALWRTG